MPCPDETIEIEKKKFVRETEIFKEQEIPGKRTPRIREHALILTETYRFYIIRSKRESFRHSLIIFRFDLNLANVVKKHLIEMEDVLMRSIEIEPQFIASDLIEIEITEGL
jgi:hypothetical protein